MTKAKDIECFNEDANLWFPDQPEIRFLGKVSYDHKQGLQAHYLEDTNIKQRFESLVNQNRVDSSILLFGDVRRIGDITLFDGYSRNEQHSWPGPTRKTFFFNQGLVGIHSEHPEQLRFGSAAIQPNGMEAWLCINPYHFTKDDLHNYTYKKPDPIDIPISKGREVSFRWSSRGPTQSITQTEVSMEALPWVQVRFDNPVGLETATSDLVKIHRLIETVSDYPFDYQCIMLRSPDHKTTIGKPPKEYFESIYYLGRSLREKAKFRSVIPSDLLFTMPQIPDLGTCIEQWLSMYDRCKAAMNAYTAQRSNSSDFAETRFFTLASVAESIQSKLYPGLKRTIPTFSQDIIDQLLIAVHENEKESIREKLNRSNAPTFRDRLRDLMSRASTITNDVIGSDQDQDDFMACVTHSRNEQAHQTGPKSKHSIRDGLNFVRTTSKLKVLIEFHLLLNLGLDVTTISKRMRLNSRYWHYASNESWPWKSES
ncbi:MAG: HEPN domain-containing protein [Planctomycetota bacterium]